MSATDDNEKLPSSAKKESPPPRKNRRRHKPLKVANQLSPKRRKEIEKAFERKSPSPKKWSRESGPKTHLFDRKRIKPGSIRKIDFNLLDVEIGDSWPIPVTIIHGSRPGPVVTILGAVHGNELVGPLALTYLCGPNFIGSGEYIDPSMLSGTIRICLLYTSPSPRDKRQSRMPSSA